MHGHVALPRGCLDDLRDLLARAGVALVIDDRRTVGETNDATFTGTLTAAQRTAVDVHQFDTRPASSLRHQARERPSWPRRSSRNAASRRS